MVFCCSCQTELVCRKLLVRKEVLNGTVLGDELGKDDAIGAERDIQCCWWAKTLGAHLSGVVTGFQVPTEREACAVDSVRQQQEDERVK